MADSEVVNELVFVLVSFVLGVVAFVGYLSIMNFSKGKWESRYLVSAAACLAMVGGWIAWKILPVTSNSWGWLQILLIAFWGWVVSTVAFLICFGIAWGRVVEAGARATHHDPPSTDDPNTNGEL